MINKADQIVPFYVMDVLGDYPGLPGLFVAGILSSALRLIQLLKIPMIIYYEES